MNHSRTITKTLYYAFIMLVIAQTVLASWVDEDAYITFRVVDNFVHGFGLTWNINERVQAYTNPLWMLLHIPLYALTDNIVLTTSMLGWACLLVVLLCAHATFGANPLRITALFLVPLLVAPVNAAYFTSGLEGPLLNALFACFAFIAVRHPKHFWFWLSLVTAASMLTRLDAVILYAPVWAYLLAGKRKHMPWKPVLAGAVPLIAWLAFSLFYYGFLLPNTAPAKLGGHLPFSDYLQSGIAYAYDFMLADPWSSFTIMAAAVYFPYVAWKKRASHNWLAAMLACGIALYYAYVITIGGAQLSMRMFSLPAFAACWLWAWHFPERNIASYAAFALIAAAVHPLFALPWDERHAVPIINKWQFGGVPWAHHMFEKTGPSVFDYTWATADMSETPDHTRHPLDVTATNVIGSYGFYGGPYHIVIDVAGLSDPLLARLPAVDNRLIKVGDVFRYIPPGYEKAHVSGSTEGLSPSLAAYYGKIQLITRGDLWDWQRLKTIVLFNLGAYDSLRAQYIHDEYPRKID